MGATDATFYFTVDSDGYADGDESWEAGFMYKPTSSSTWTSTNEIQGSGEGTFQQQVSGLSENTQYEVMAYMTNSAGTSYGDKESGTTTYIINFPSITNLGARDVNETTSILSTLQCRV